MAKKRKWLYKKAGRWYGDFRPYADVGGGQEALKPEGAAPVCARCRIAASHVACIDEAAHLSARGAGTHAHRRGSSR